MESDLTNQQVVSNRSSPQEQITDQSPSSQKGFTPIILGVIILLIVVAGGVYYLGIKKTPTDKSPSSVEVSQTPPQTVTTQSTSSAVANWETYTESTYKFTIKYPAGWIVTPFDYKKFPVASSDQPQALVSFVNKSYEGMEFGTPGLIDVGITYIKPKAPFTDFLAQEKTVSNKSPEKPTNIIDEVVNVDGIQSSKVTYQYNEFTNKMVYIPKNESVFIIRSQVLNKDISLNAEFFDQILSTFKFTN